MCSLQIWREAQLQGATVLSYTMNHNFRRNLQKAVTGDCEGWANTDHLGVDKHAKSVQDLQKYSVERWDLLLQFLVGSVPFNSIGSDLCNIIMFSQLMKCEDVHGSQAYSITNKGFQFLLLDKPSQVWFFVLEYLNWVQENGLNLVSILRFIFEISFTPPGKDLPMEGRSDDVMKCLLHFREMGLLFLRKRKSRRFYPTPLATNLVNGANKAAMGDPKNGFIIAETNYRVYAYTDSELQFRILSLFCEMLYRFPNLCVMQITRESIQTAVVNGITSEQILHYIRANAHPDMLKNDPIVAPTLADQVTLWAMERDRLVFRDGVLYNQFLTQKDFEVLKNYAKDLGALVWENSDNRCMVVTHEGHGPVKDFWKKYRKGNVNQ